MSITLEYEIKALVFHLPKCTAITYLMCFNYANQTHTCSLNVLSHHCLFSYQHTASTLPFCWLATRGLLICPIDELVCRIDHLAQLSEGQTDQSVDKGQTIAIFY